MSRLTATYAFKRWTSILWRPYCLQRKTPLRPRSSHGWRELTDGDKQALIDAIVSGSTERGPFHLELDLCDRCNVDCYFCNAMDVRTKEQVPLDRVTDIVDAATPAGLKSVRLAGGGDPLFHHDILAVLDLLADRRVAVDNVTTNGVALTEEVARRFVEQAVREVVVSLNAANATDYARMMRVKPALFDRVLANVSKLVDLRADGPFPALAIQFLVDRRNFSDIVGMYRLGQSLGADTIAINLVLEIPNERIDRDLLLGPADVEKARPHLSAVLEEDRDAHLLELCFDRPEYNDLLNELRSELKVDVRSGIVTAPSFSDENGGCFFAFYTGVVRGNGDMYPCCMLMQPDYQPLGNAVKNDVLDEWSGASFNRARHEMRQVLLAGRDVEYQPERFKALKPQCVNAHSCGLKNMYFRHDEKFYTALGEALELARRREIRWWGTRKQMARAARRAKFRHPTLRRLYEAVIAASPKVHRHLKRLMR